MKPGQKKDIPSKQDLVAIAQDEMDFIKHRMMIDILRPPSCWKLPAVVVSDKRLYQTLMVGKEPRRNKKNHKGYNYYNEEPNEIVANLSDLNLSDKPEKIVHPLQGKYVTDNVIYLYYNTIYDKSKELELDFEDYFRQVVAHEVFHSIHYAYIKDYFFKGCCQNSWPMADAFALDYWRGTGMKRNQVIAVREGLARIFECGWCLFRNKLEQGAKLEQFLLKLAKEEPNNPYGKGLSILKRYEGQNPFYSPLDFAINLVYGVLLETETSAVYNNTRGELKYDNGWEEVYKELGAKNNKIGPNLTELMAYMKPETQSL